MGTHLTTRQQIKESKGKKGWHEKAMTRIGYCHFLVYLNKLEEKKIKTAEHTIQQLKTPLSLSSIDY